MAATAGQCEVLIVGGSLVGLSAAAFLGHHGIAAQVVEKHAGTSIHPRAGYFHVGTMEAYRRIGLEPAILEESHEQFGPDGAINLVESLAGRELAFFVPSINAGIEPYSPCRRFFMTQQSLEPLLHRRATGLGAALHYRTELIGFEQHADHVLAEVRDLDSGEIRTIRAKWMIAADGNRSPVREKLGIAMRGPGWLSDSITIYFKADCRPWLEGRQLGVIYVSNADQRGFFRFEAGGTRGFLAVNTLGDLALPGAKTVASDISHERCVALVRSAVGVPDLAVEIEDVATWKATAECASAYRKGRVFLAGDAAHVVPPTGGFGGNTGVQDAANLAWKLALVVRGEAGEALLDSYEAERLPVGQLTVEQAYARYIRRVVPEEIGPDTPEMRDELTMELGQFYRSDAVIGGREPVEPACLHPDLTRGRPGSRVPHVWFAGSYSTVDSCANTFAVLCGREGHAWSKAARDAMQGTVDLLSAWEFAEGGIEQLGVGPTGAVLVRPDGFVAARALDDSTASPATLRGWLATALGYCRVTHVHGRCHCGAISYEAQVDPAGVAICHCADCQTFAGAPYRAMVRPLPGTLRMTGTPTHYTKTADSGRLREQAFCGTCGSHLYACDPGEAREGLSLRIGAIAERHELAPPVRQVWCESALAWAFDLSGVPQTARQT